MSNIDPRGQAEAARLGRGYRGQAVNLDEGLPFSIYGLFEQVTGRDYSQSQDDQLTILEYASAFEKAQAPAG